MLQTSFIHPPAIIAFECEFLIEPNAEELNMSDLRTKCHTCDGKGKVRGLLSILRSCPDCDGTGQIPNVVPSGQDRVHSQRTGYPALTWSAEKPKAAGWWWVKGHKDTSVTAVRFFNGKLLVYIYEINADCPIDDPRISHWRWAGPLPEPQEPPPVESLDNGEAHRPDSETRTPETK